MKRMYEMLMAYEEAFVANEYVSACITGIIQCAYPGNGRTNGRTDKFDDYNGHKSGYWTDSQGKLHGLCGYDGDKHSGTYSHIGRLNITNIDDHHPNHS